MARPDCAARREAFAAALRNLKLVHQTAETMSDNWSELGDAAAALSPSHPLVTALGMEEEIAKVLAGPPPVIRCPSGLSRRDREARAAERRMRVLEMSLDGRTVADIAEELGLVYDYVVQLRRKLGVGRKRGKG